MAALAHATLERRRGARRTAADVSAWRPEAVLRPGLLVRLVNIGPFGVMVESPGRMRPGRPVELQLFRASSDRKVLLPGRVVHCAVFRLHPLGFHGSIAFDGELHDHADDG